MIWYAAATCWLMAAREPVSKLGYSITSGYVGTYFKKSIQGLSLVNPTNNDHY